MDFFNKTKLTIVHDKTSEKYANYLKTLLSVADDDGENIVGVKDGSVDAAVWDEKQYAHNKPQLANEDHVLFIGANSKVLKNECYGINSAWDQYGMGYGWLGKRGFLNVYDGIKRKEYEDFFNLAGSYQKSVSNVMAKKGIDVKNLVAGAAGAGIAGAAGAAAAAGGVALYGGGAALGILLSPIVPIVWPIALLPIAILDKANKEKLREQQFNFLILKFYYDAIKDFLNQ